MSAGGVVWGGGGGCVFQALLGFFWTKSMHYVHAGPQKVQLQFSFHDFARSKRTSVLQKIG